MNSIPSSKTVLSILAANPVASRVFQLSSLLEHNKDFIASSEVPMRRKKPSQRDTTPLFDAPSDFQIKLCTDVHPRDLTKGWCFGSDPKFCDILLDEDNSNGVSALHFEINHNWTSFAVIITNRSRNTLTIKLPRQDSDQIRQGERRALLKEPGMVSLSVGLLKLILEIPERGDPASYERNLRAYYEDSAKAVPSLTKLNVWQHKNPTPAVKLHRYFEEELLGSGSYGRVHSGIDGITGDVVALKTYHDKTTNKTIEREVDTLKRLKHENIVHFIDYVPKNRLLVMEYAVYGTLDACKYLSHSQLYRLAKQMTSGLSYLHNEGITHRDVKPANILIVSKEPHFNFKLADFSDSSSSTNLTTFCGTPMYQAPEVKGANYSNAIDIWSLGVVLIERWCDWYPDFVYYLGIETDTFLLDTLRNTKIPDNRSRLREGLTWTDEVRKNWVEFVRAGLKKSDNMVVKLFLNMFQEDPRIRWSAGYCYNYLQLPEVQNLPEIASAITVMEAPEQQDLHHIDDLISRPSKRSKLSDNGLAKEMVEVHFLPSEREMSATGLWRASGKRNWPLPAICGRYNFRTTKTHYYMSYDDGLDLANRLELRKSSVELLNSWTRKQSTEATGSVRICLERLEDIPKTHKIVHIWPPGSIINATNILACAGKPRSSIPSFLKYHQFLATQRRHSPRMQGTYVGYADGLRLCELVGIPTEKVKLAMDDGWIGPLLEIRTGNAPKAGRPDLRTKASNLAPEDSDRLGTIDEDAENRGNKATQESEKSDASEANANDTNGGGNGNDYSTPITANSPLLEFIPNLEPVGDPSTTFGFGEGSLGNLDSFGRLESLQEEFETEDFSNRFEECVGSFFDI